jgi:hypothetical protein
VYPKNRRGRLSPREQKEATNRSHDFIAAAMPPDKAAEYRAQFIKVLPPKRERIRRPVDGKPLESSVNDGIYHQYKDRGDVKLWRNNRGVAQYGSQTVVYGVGPRGASDWIGYRCIKITPEMVGQVVAQFAALEAKRLGEQPDERQQRFIDTVNADGGCAGWADSAEKAREVIP